MENADRIKKWFTGKALRNVTDYVIPTLTAAEAQGFWPKGASRKVRAALNKQAVAIRFGRANDRRNNNRDTEDHSGRLADIMDNRREWWESTVKGWDLVHAMSFGIFERAAECLAHCDALFPLTVNDAERAALATAREWAADFAEIAALVKLLDSRRPPMVVVFKTLSPTVLAHLGLEMNMRIETVRFPPMHFEWRTMVDRQGRSVQYMVGIIDWPSGTRHGASRFAPGTANNSQCEACGHAIKDAGNWVPILIDNADGVPHSFWIGRDCTRNLFGAEVSGDTVYEEAQP